MSDKCRKERVDNGPIRCQPPPMQNRTGFRWVPEYEGLYEINSDGVIYSLHRSGRLLKQKTDPDGYKSVSLSKRGVKKGLRVHRLVLMAFVRMPSEGEISRHLDGTKANNCLENLAWSTQLENQRDRRKHGTAPIGENHGRAKLCDKHVREIRARVAAGESMGKMSRVFNVGGTTIGHVIAGRTWTHVK